jgi:hypothetical protein
MRKVMLSRAGQKKHDKKRAGRDGRAIAITGI